MSTVSNLDEAKAACLKDENCGMFYDSGGRGERFFSCPFATKYNYGRMVKRSWGSVLYLKGKLYLSNRILNIICRMKEFILSNKIFLPAI